MAEPPGASHLLDAHFPQHSPLLELQGERFVQRGGDVFFGEEQNSRQLRILGHECLKHNQPLTSSGTQHIKGAVQSEELVNKQSG